MNVLCLLTQPYYSLKNANDQSHFCVWFLSYAATKGSAFLQRIALYLADNEF
jgi:hypothetical protein